MIVRELMLLMLMLTSFGANAAAVTSLDVAGGFFSMNAPTGSVSDSAIGAFSFNMGAYQGDEASIGSGFSDSAIVTFDFGFYGPISLFTAASSNQSGVAGGGPEPSGITDVQAGTITLDFSGLFASWCCQTWYQGHADTVGVYDAMTGAFSVKWNQLIVGGTFDGNMGYWELSGFANVAAVPVPAAFWLFVSGLLGLAGFAHRRKAC